MRILVAEDDFTSRTMLQAILTKWGYDVIAAEDGNAAHIAFLTTDAPQLALLDWEMPGMSGIDLCRMLRKKNRNNPLYLILLTARGHATDIAEGLEAGADDYIAKPFDNTELKARIDVGRRIIALQNEMREHEKLQGVMEMAGAVCHELNQPLQSVSGFSEILLMDIDASDRNYETLKAIKAGIDRIGELTRRVMKVTRYQSKPYLKGQIVDIDQSSS